MLHGKFSQKNLTNHKIDLLILSYGIYLKMFLFSLKGFYSLNKKKHFMTAIFNYQFFKYCVYFKC